VRRRDAYERDPAAFTAHWRKEDEAAQAHRAARASGWPRDVPDAALERAARCAWRWAPTACAAN
jgi:magnesium chelatase subunit I